MRKFGLIGKSIEYSFSPQYFKNKFDKEGIKDCVYGLYDIASISEFDEIKLDQSIVGLNVTIPYKESIIPYLDSIQKEAQIIGAVNTILIKNGKSRGFNTDVYGFEKSLKELIKRKPPKRALILGSGGSSKAIAHVLNKMSINYRVVSRKNKGSKNISYQDLTQKRLSYYHLIINTTPVGVFPKVNKAPAINYDFLGPEHLLYDLIYNPEKTLFLKRGEAQGCQILNGKRMLELQAEKSWKIWNNLR